ncbi:MAG: single-stranded DNA-binding protein [Wolbachia endosymbiont of Fragariocoptes setiger]|nr:single-stranded DNA-binding protein [Wolbachia endosymbiont of Fragariocoptes setiger]
MSSSSVNKVILIGNLGKDPEIRMMQNGKEMASFSIATSESWTDKLSGLRSEKTEWHNIVVFSEGLVKIIKDLARKGNKVYIEGSLRTRKWSDQSGNEKYTTEVVLYNFNSTFALLDSRQNYDHKLNKPEIENNHTKDQFIDTESNHTKDQFIDDEIPF